MIWATHWLVSASWRHITAQRAGRAYQARSTEGLLSMIPALSGINRYPVESALKAIGGLLLFILQITYGGYKNLVCEFNMEPREGRLATQHLNSWAHGTMNLGFSLSGMVELLGAHSKLPQGTNLALLGGAFFIEGLLFDMHEKNGHLDQTVHWLLAMTCFAGAIFAILEAAFPENFLLTAGRAGSMLLQGTWFCQAAAVLFGGSLVWDDNYNGHEDQAPAMFLPMVFAYHLLLVTAFVVLVYAGLEAYSRRAHPASLEAGTGSPSFGGFETSRLLSDDQPTETGVMMTPMTGMRNGLRK
ncbi:hypothetical protein PLESTB_000177200 [Pleodorina starrii]|uniref:Uncharacterized protein n=1 Tax=Pleodorina starrii TaxID=330485 RepID=A0A9W6BBH8_9CHLO|nr:hypothetical protein PLESTB_000177200 [Pleodorina starrii]GLC66154.1 hypothetical protein PLESTF_000390800 [Pleodorina starrii]